MATARPVALRVFEALKVALIKGELRVGSRYSAPELARSLGVSATPVREAMLNLVRLGVVAAEPNAGFRILEPTIKKLADLTELRAMVEVTALIRIAEKCTGEVARSVRALRHQARVLDHAAKQGHMEDYVSADLEFHTRLIDLYGNERLTELVAELLTVTRLLLPGITRETFSTDTFHDHESLVRLLLARDTAGIDSLMRAHFQAMASQAEAYHASRP